MKIFCDQKELTPATLVTIDRMNSVYRKRGGELMHIEGSRTNETLRYGNNDSELPFEITFTDRFDHNWKVVIDKKDDVVNMFIPCGSQILWYGADEATRTATDAQTQWASIQFTWQDKTFLPPFHAGLRVAFTAYKDKTAGEWSVNAEHWNKILDLAKQGTEITDDVIEQI